MELKIDNLTPEQIDVIKTQIDERRERESEPKDVIDYEWVGYMSKKPGKGKVIINIRRFLFNRSIS